MAPAGLPDWDDLGRTAFDATPYALAHDGDEPKERAKLASHARVRSRFAGLASAEIPFDAMNVLDAIGEAQLALTLDLVCLESASATVAYDVSARAAGDTLRTRIGELAEVRDALQELYLEASSPRAALCFTPGRPLAAYTRGVQVWAGAVVRTLTTLAGQLRTLTPDWVALRRELASASAWCFDGLVPSVRDDVAASGAPELVDACEELSWAASLAIHGLAKPFG